MINDFGLHYGIDAFRRETKNSSDITEMISKNKNYDKIIAYPFLLRSKFPITILFSYALERINTIYDFTRNMDFAIYDEETNYTGVPKTFQNRPI